MRFFPYFTTLLVLFLLTIPIFSANAASALAERVSGRILLDVATFGEAWWVNPETKSRYYLGLPKDAFEIMRFKSLGITNEDLAKIPTSSESFTGDMALRERLSGYILLQVEENGEAWYVFPGDSKRYYMGRPADAFDLMTNLSLGISVSDLKQIVPVPPPNFTVAFLGDAGVGTNAKKVLDLVQANDTNLVIHAGDLGYEGGEDAWLALIRNRFGKSFPYLYPVGNHDLARWDDYQDYLELQTNHVPGLHCDGELGVNSHCFYNGFSILLSGVGTKGSDNELYLAQNVTRDDVLWRICSWHKNQRLMQVGDKTDEVGWGPYELCRQAGAIIATGHDHAFARTHLMSQFSPQNILSTASTIRLTRGNTLALVSGLGGRGIHSTDAGLAANSWWGSVYSKDQGAKPGALF